MNGKLILHILSVYECLIYTYLSSHIFAFVLQGRKGMQGSLAKQANFPHQKGSAELLVAFLFKCATHAFCTTHFLTTLFTRVENLTSNFLWGHKNAGWKPLSCMVFKEQSSIELKLYTILQYLADRWHKPNLLLREACWLASHWACMEKDI